MKNLNMSSRVKYVLAAVSVGALLSVSCINTASKFKKNPQNESPVVETKPNASEDEDGDIPLRPDTSLSHFLSSWRSRGISYRVTVADWLMEHGIMYSSASIADGYEASDIDSFISIYQNSPPYRYSLLKGVKKGISTSSLILPIFYEEGIPADFLLLPIIESSYDPTLFSSKGAAGVWQFMPGTAVSYGLTVHPELDERRDFYKSARAAAKYLKTLYERFKDWSLVVAAYNVGEYNVQRLVDRYLAAHPGSKRVTFWDIRDSLPRETRNYVPRFFAIVKIMHNPESYGFPEFDTMTVEMKKLRICKISGQFHLTISQLADMAGLSLPAFIRYNPQFTGRELPAGKTVFFYLPESNYEIFQQHLSELADVLAQAAPAVTSTSSLNPGNGQVTRSTQTVRHIVKKGETLDDIARRYGTTARELKLLNGLTSGIIYPGQVLTVPDERMASR